MHLRSILPSRTPSRSVWAGVGLVVLISTLGVNGCVSYKLTSLYVEPSAGACVPPGGTSQFTAYGTYTEGGHAAKTQDVSDMVSWTTDLPQLATVDSTGLAAASPTAIGITNVKASTEGEFGLIWSSAQLTVKTDCVSSSIRTLSDIRILPGDQNLASIGDTTGLVAVGHFSKAPWSSDLSQQVQWSSSNPEVASVTSGGTVIAAAAGETTIMATRATEQGAVVTSKIKVVVGGSSANQ